MPLPMLWKNSPVLIRSVFVLLLLTTAASRAQTITESSAFPIEQGALPACVPDEHTLCLIGGRFSVTAAFQLTPSGPSFEANAVPFTDNSGYFWFFDASNIELVVKILNACVDPFNSYWVFTAGLTNVGVEITVTDTRSGESKRYENPLGTPFAPIQDTAGFATCP